MKTLNKLHTSVKSITEKFYVIDVETNGLQATPDKFIFGCMYGYEYKKVFYSTDAIKKELQKKRFRHKYIFAHNAEFDFSVIYGNIKQNLDTGAIFNNRFILAQSNQTYYADSFNIFPCSVKKLGESIGIHKLDLNEKFKTGKTKIRITKKDIEYCYRDCEIVYKALHNIFTLIGSVKPTLAGLSLLLYRKKYQPYSIQVNTELNNRFFESYYGGRVECFKLGKTLSYKYDVNSMYPYAMTNTVFPNPKYLREGNTGFNWLKYYMKYYEGCTDVTVIHKEKNYGFLPLRKDGKLFFPVGTFRSNYNFNELRFALKHNVIQIIKIHSVVYSHRMQTPFKTFAKDLYRKRKQSKGIYNYIYKLLLNSLYGKFGQKNKIKEVYFPEIDYNYLFKLLEKKTEYELKMFSEDRKDCYVQVKQAKDYLHTIPLFSSYITSQARVHLLRLMLKYNKHIITYCDTDCIAVEKKIKGLNSTCLGGAKIETEIIKHIHGNKNYLTTHGLKLKGIPKNFTKIDKNIYTFVKLIKTKESIRRNIQTGKQIQVTKVISNRYEKRTKQKNGFTRPVVFTNNEG